MESGEYNVHGHLSLSPEKAQGSTSNDLVDLTPSFGIQESLGQARNPHMQAVWEKTVCTELEIPYKYRTVAVLIVRWADYLDRDLKCAEEAQELNELFAKQFHFQSSILTLDDKRNPQLQLRNGIDNLVLNHDGPCRTTLLILYYTGHGIGRDEQGLDISGVREEGVSAIAPKFLAIANWNEAEESLVNKAEADVLTILDCCSAGSIMKGPTEDIRTFEILAATIQKMPTEPPGRRSFTRALIAALREQLQKSDQMPFTTYELNEEIMRRRKVQRSHLFCRNTRNGHRFIKLAPLELDGMSDPPFSAAHEASYLTVRFSFKDTIALKPEHIERLAKKVAQGASDFNLGINRVDWVGFQENKNGERFAEFVRLLRAVKHTQRRWREQVRGKQLKRPRSEINAEETAPPAKRSKKASKNASSWLKESCDPLSPPQSAHGSPPSKSMFRYDTVDLHGGCVEFCSNVSVRYPRSRWSTWTVCAAFK